MSAECIVFSTYIRHSNIIKTLRENVSTFELYYRESLSTSSVFRSRYCSLGFIKRYMLIKHAKFCKINFSKELQRVWLIASRCMQTFFLFFLAFCIIGRQSLREVVIQRIRDAARNTQWIFKEWEYEITLVPCIWKIRYALRQLTKNCSDWPSWCICRRYFCDLHGISLNFFYWARNRHIRNSKKRKRRWEKWQPDTTIVTTLPGIWYRRITSATRRITGKIFNKIKKRDVL